MTLGGVVRLQEPSIRMTSRTRTEEEAMPEPRNGGSVKTLAIRLPDELHAQLGLVAQLDELTLTDAIRQAIEEFIDRKRAEGDFASRAAAMLEEIDREAATRRQSIEALFGKAGPSDESGEPSKGRTRRGEPST
jgi:predicted transcriptional regulator